MEVALRHSLLAYFRSHSLARGAGGGNARRCAGFVIAEAEEPALPAEIAIGHRFADRRLLAAALTHPGAEERARGQTSFERLEFLGDRVLGLLIAEWLHALFVREAEGALAKRLAWLASGEAVAACMEKAGLSPFIRTGAHTSLVDTSIVADAGEAIIGALYLDAGLDVARAFVHRLWADLVTEQPAPPREAKTVLQEWAQARGLPLPRYEMLSREGPDHDPVFAVAVVVEGAPRGEGRARSLRAAQKLAAADVLRKLGLWHNE
jgi:ribonuclease-3